MSCAPFNSCYIRATLVVVSVLEFDGKRQCGAKKRRRKERDPTIVKVNEYAIPELVRVLNRRTRCFHPEILANHKNPLGPLPNKPGLLGLTLSQS
jgi:hypothetical protein